MAGIDKQLNKQTISCLSRLLGMNWASVDEREQKSKSEQKALKDYLRNQNEEMKRRKQMEKSKEIEEYRKITQKPSTIPVIHF